MSPAAAVAALRSVCRCYVRDLEDETIFGLRSGAHDPACPVYRPSGDPVDRDEDREARATSRGDKLAPRLVARRRSGSWGAL